ncbi:phage tail assembly chaperone [Diaphorobacter caeni]|uniref:phage tail assembly chaperone n=1 Tax=Diaphorobacter caeni TaxID=2784387 RepID=UPI00188EF35F|nr:phage tail assembly chaperone [Diaphorobacter caeni]MBF5006008.1 hypothetical protein [Diaphorobacter caeni]
MAKSLKSFAPAPIFDAKAQITVPGKPAQSLGVRFKFHDRKAMRDLGRDVDALSKDSRSEDGPLSDEQYDELTGKQVDLLMRVMDGWELEDEFNRDNLIAFLDTFTMGFGELITAFFRSHSEAKAKN